MLMGEFGTALLFTCVLLVITVHPVMRILNIWWVEKALTGKELAIVLGIHAVFTFVPVMYGWFGFSLGYTVLLNIGCLCLPFFRTSYRKRFLREVQDKEVRRLQQLVEENPGDPTYLGALGGAYLAFGQYDEAIWSYRQALKLLPEEGSRHEQARLKQALKLREYAAAQSIPRLSRVRHDDL